MHQPCRPDSAADAAGDEHIVTQDCDCARDEASPTMRDRPQQMRHQATTPQRFTVWLAGGGVRGGMTYGATDEFGYRAVENVVEMHDLHATMLHLLGMDHERLTFLHGGRFHRLTDVHGRVIREVLA